jgi:hypothetical protein
MSDQGLAVVDIPLPLKDSIKHAIMTEINKNLYAFCVKRVV